MSKTALKVTDTAQKLKKLTVKKIDLANAKVGSELTGRFCGLVQGQPFKTVDEKTGELIEKTLTSAVFEDAETGERFSVIADKGLQSHLAEAMVKEGDWIKVVKMEKTKLSRGRTMNQYDIYAWER